ncbi:ABC transporter substrate-binding protein [Chelativorans oligotrophicus]|jgi:peptide/nickel transport system substrate-binding protein|uniref:Extracellular solute-binding protein, family 5 n=1 Tax=Chelativorans sp. (strain BNC1) TaxID=266779 RepID=Q11KW0_CHESB|nr:ABC transporter substrate-binding protein [Chelativorans oligotrophicus]
MRIQMGMKAKAAFITIGAIITVANSLSNASAQTSGGDLVTVMRADPKGLIPAFPHGGDTRIIAAKIFEGLISYSTDLRPLPGLAKSWEISSDGLTYTFKLQNGVHWNDGKEFSSADVLFSLNEMLPATNAAAKQALEEVKSIEAPDAETVVITLKRRVPYFLMLFPGQQMPIMPKHIYEGTDYIKNPANLMPIGTGPFELVEWKRGSYVRLEKNENYWKKPEPYLDSITYRIMPDASSRAIALESGDVNVATSGELSSSDIARFKTSGEFRMDSKGWEYFASQALLVINVRNHVLQDARFRQALSYALDKRFILDHVWNGTGAISTGPVSHSIPFYTDKISSYSFDPKKASALLDEIGLRAGADDKRLDAQGNPITVKLLILPGEPYGRLAEYIREAWRGIGIATDLQAVDLGNWYDRMANWNFDVAIANLGQFADPGIGARSYYHSGNIKKGVMFSNMGGYKNGDVDALFDQASLEMDPERRGEIYHQIQQKIVTDAPAIWLIDLERFTVSQKNVHNLVTDAFGPWGSWASAYIE